MTTHSSSQGDTMGTCQTKAIQVEVGIFTHIPAYLDIFRSNQACSWIIRAYSDIFKTLGNISIFKTLVYSEPWHIQNQGHIQNPAIFRTLAYLKSKTYTEPWYIHILGILRDKDMFKTLAFLEQEVYSEPWHIQNLREKTRFGKNVNNDKYFH